MRKSRWLTGAATGAIAVALSSGAWAGDWWDNTSINGRMYFDMSYVSHESDGQKSYLDWNTYPPNLVDLKDNGYGFDIKRFYVGIDHQFSDVFSGHITTDFQYKSAIGSTELYIKKAYLEAKISDALDIRLGSTDLPWVPFVEGLYGYRYVENVMIDRTKFGTSADWGIHAKGKLADGVISYAFSVINGAGYKSPPGAGNGTHFKSVDFEGRVSAKWHDVTIGVGGYSGKLGKNVQGVNTSHTAQRLDAVAAYIGNGVRVGVEYFHAWDWKNVTTAYSDSSQGVSAFASYQFNPKWAVFGRYDYVKPQEDTVSSLKDNYFNVGIQYSPVKIVDISLVYKRDKADKQFDGWQDFIATSNGSIGGFNDGTYDEVGVFSRFRW